MNEGPGLIARLEFGFPAHQEVVSLATESKMVIKVKFLDLLLLLLFFGEKLG
jgi:hypothetical protein